MKTDDWAVVENYGYDIVQIVAVKPQTITYRRPGGVKQGRVMSHKIVFTHADQARAEAVAHKLISAKEEQRRREQAARGWFNNELARIVKEASA